MKKILPLIILILFTGNLQAQKANLFTIPNQSAQFIRMPAREASIDIDAVFYNPANLPSMGKGVFISINNQILNQSSSIESEYQGYTTNPKTYEGNVRSFVFPSVFLNWNINKVSFHGGFMIVGGAGGVDYANLPVSDRGISDVPLALINSDFVVAPGLLDLDAQIESNTGTNPGYSNILDYRYTFKNKGLGFSPGVQTGVAYKFNKYFSAALDLRWMSQTFTSEGEVSNIQILPGTANTANNEWIAPGEYLRMVGQETGESGYEFAAGIYEDLSADRFINVRQRGSGWTFIPSILVNPTEKLFIALKYEHRTKVTLTTKVRDGADGGMQGGRPVFIEGEEIRSDLPGFISGGIGYQFTDRWRVNFGGRYVFIKGADFAGREQFIDKNYYEVEFGTEYKIGKKLFLSCGYTYNKAGVLAEYHNDVDFWIPGHTLGFGGKFEFTKALCLDAGFMYTRNVTQEFTYNNHVYSDGFELAGKPADYDNTHTMKFEKSSFIIGLGLSIKIYKNVAKTPNLRDEESESDTPFNFRG